MESDQISIQSTLKQATQMQSQKGKKSIFCASNEIIGKDLHSEPPTAADVEPNLHRHEAG
jgi:hypothetical protein